MKTEKITCDHCGKELHMMQGYIKCGVEHSDLNHKIIERDKILRHLLDRAYDFCSLVCLGIFFAYFVPPDTFKKIADRLPICEE